MNSNVLVDTFMMIAVSSESGSWFESSGSKSGGMICSNCKTFRCASDAANDEPPPFMFRPVKDEDQTVVSAAEFAIYSMLTDQYRWSYTAVNEILRSPLMMMMMILSIQLENWQPHEVLANSLRSSLCSTARFKQQK